MGDPTRVITLGIGPAATIDGLVLTGLNIYQVPDVKGAVVISDSTTYAVSLADALFGSAVVVNTTLGWHGIGLEDGSGMWLFEDGSEIAWFDGTTGLTIGDS